MANVSIDYDSIRDLINGQILALINSDPQTFGNVSLFVENERQFTKRKDVLLTNSVYVVLSYGDSSVNFGQSVLPVTIKIISEKNSLDLSQKLFSAYVSAYNLVRTGSTMQVYQTPRVMSAMNEIGNGFRAYMAMESVFVIGGSLSDPITSIQFLNGASYEEIPLLSFSDSYANSLAPQPLPGSGGFAKSVSSFASYSFSISTYLTSSAFCGAVNNCKYADGHENDSFVFKLSQISGAGFTGRSFKCVSVITKQNIGENPIISVTFTL